MRTHTLTMLATSLVAVFALSLNASHATAQDRWNTAGDTERIHETYLRPVEHAALHRGLNQTDSYSQNLGYDSYRPSSAYYGMPQSAPLNPYSEFAAPRSYGYPAQSYRPVVPQQYGPQMRSGYGLGSNNGFGGGYGGNRCGTAQRNSYGSPCNRNQPQGYPMPRFGF